MPAPYNNRLDASWTWLMAGNAMDDQSHKRPRLSWRRRPEVRLRADSPSLREATSPHRNRAWQIEELRLAPPTARRLIEIDGEIGGVVSTARAGPNRFPGSVAVEKLGAQEVLGAITPRADGDWLVKSGLWIDARLAGRYDLRSRRHLAHRAGPLWAALMAARFGLRGYLAAVALRRACDFAPALSTSAFVQQVEAGAIDEPLLRAHLLYGARVVAIFEDLSFPAAIVRWRR